jgi:ribosomal protein S18 acetylase RimI-like enzyme
LQKLSIQQAMEQITIRKARKEDMETLLRFEQGVINAERPFDVTIKQEDTQYYNLPLLIDSDDSELVVAEVDNQLIASGYARIENSKLFFKHAQHAYLGFMYTVPEYRGRGVNAMILEALKNWSRSKHITELHLEVYVDNLPAIKAYEKMGFVKNLIEMRLGLEEE